MNQPADPLPIDGPIGGAIAVHHEIPRPIVIRHPSRIVAMKPVRPNGELSVFDAMSYGNRVKSGVESQMLCGIFNISIGALSAAGCLNTNSALLGVLCAVLFLCVMAITGQESYSKELARCSISKLGSGSKSDGEPTA